MVAAVMRREPYVWAALIMVVWLVVVLVIVGTAGDVEPNIDAGTVLMALPLAGFGASIVAGARGRDLHWATRCGVTLGLALAGAYLVQVVVRGEFGALYLVPMLAFVAAAILWLCCAAGWLVGGVVRHGLGLGGSHEDDDEGFL
ncbi:hypothetical protein BH23ACT3_BH23ACT3_06940 [soil metagenome]